MKAIDASGNVRELYLAGGCFWGLEHYFKQIEGVLETEVGYANGSTENPTYQEVYTDKTGIYYIADSDLRQIWDVYQWKQRKSAARWRWNWSRCGTSWRAAAVSRANARQPVGSTFSRIPLTFLGSTLPKTLPSTSTTGASPHAPTQRRLSSENIPSGVV
jgi:hypothetical protein